MFDFDSLREIGATISKNKLRTFLTGFSIAWGIFMLIVLLGAGNGLKNGITANFSNRAKNAVSVGTGYVSMPYKGLPVDRQVKFDNKDYDLLRNKIPEVDYVSAQIERRSTISFNKEYGSWGMNGVYPDAAYIGNIDMSTGTGRFINQIDMDQKRKVIVINTEMQEVLFKGEDPLGKYVTADGIAYQVVGVYKDESGRTNIPSFVPFSTAQSLYGKGYNVDRLDFTVKGIKTMPENEAFIKRLREKLGALHNFDPEDKSAIWIWNTAEEAVQTEAIFGGITMFIWVVGIASLIAGIVGVGNIMLITVKERTREFGIRKAIGANPYSILKLVLLESIIITTAFGYIGMVVGVGLTELISEGMRIAPASTEGGPSVFKDPTVDLGIVLAATLVLIVSGVFAGYIPAKKAVSISPIEAMRSE
ncbi:putative ABC transport system permease protein [Dysgonomonas alginatilytica]|uniref:Putative ABC transport system permease protein n=1 Tax=Dysgonomonas alginatilytica TaxID=1605892 RepID=A0A2V3PSS0_9BACT|nr:ABC transporter permease [Dysgonomonas alginatilytica]PXV68059.1 putative ABC transport system permease protein [Dysgonomonas alginatilytica]